MAGGALAGVIVALLSIPLEIYHFLKSISCEQVLTSAIGSTGYQILGVGFFLVMGITLFRIACKKA